MESPITQALARLRSRQPADLAGLSPSLASEVSASGVAFVAIGGTLEGRWLQAMRELDACIRPVASSPPILNEGGVYAGSWLESTASISAEVLSRFAPQVAQDTFTELIRHQRGDGLIPYKVTDSGPGYSQIQLVTPLARSVWNHYKLNSASLSWLRMMYEGMARYDEWLKQYRDTRGTGGVEAFCTYDTGHDLSPRFWFTPERCFHGEATKCDPDFPALPYIAPDLTANVACQRSYLALIAEELHEEPDLWRESAASAVAALYEHCFDEEEGLFFDLDAHDQLVRVRSDVLLRVLGCEVPPAEYFTQALESFLMRTSAFLSHYGFTSIAMDDPRYDSDFKRNSWAGPVNFLTQLRAPHAFEHYGRPAELQMVSSPLLSALAAADTFPQCIDGWSGTPGFTSIYSPAILWFLDNVERRCGILPLPDGGAAVSANTPSRLDHGASAIATAYSRLVGPHRIEVGSDDEHAEIHVDGVLHVTAPRGWRVELNGDLEPIRVTSLLPRRHRGELKLGPTSIDLDLGPNDVALIDNHRVVEVSHDGFTPPRY